MSTDAQAAYTKALTRIESCRRRGANGTFLDFNGLNLEVLPPEIGQLTSLAVLYLAHNQLKSLPSEIGRLALLTELDLSDNLLTTLPPEICGLLSLKILRMDMNDVTSLPPEIGQVKMLNILTLEGNRLRYLPEEIGNLGLLQCLTLDDNNLVRLPSSLLRLSSLKELYLHGNINLQLPLEVMGSRWMRKRSFRVDIPSADPKSILDYYFRIQDSLGSTKTAAKPLLEARIIVIGDGAAGKTSLVRQLLRGEVAREHEASTRDVVVEPWGMTLRKKKVQVNVWDFGGQKQMHAAHPYFFTTRTLYLVVAEARKDQQDRVDYWLKMVARYGGEARALVVVNKADGHGLSLDRPKLLDRYQTNLPENRSEAFFATSCTEGTGIAELKAGILQQIETMDQVWALWPNEWFRVKQSIHAMRNPEVKRPGWLKKVLTRLPSCRMEASSGPETLPYSEWNSLCHECGVRDEADREDLLRMLGHLGLVVCFPEQTRLRGQGVLNPEWVTRGIYPLLVDTRLAERGGLFTLEDLRDCLPRDRYPVEKHPWLVDLMLAFELIFQDASGRLLMPAQLPADSPPWAQPQAWKDAGTLHLELRYDGVLPESVISQFIVRRHADARVPEEWWRDGICLRRDGCEALVRAHATEQEAKIELRLRGPRAARRDLLSSIRETLRDPQDASPPVLHIVLGKGCAPAYHELVIHAQSVREMPFIIDGKSVMRELAPILDLVEVPQGAGKVDGINIHIDQGISTGDVTGGQVGQKIAHSLNRYGAGGVRVV